MGQYRLWLHIEEHLEAAVSPDLVQMMVVAWETMQAPKYAHLKTI